jgi:hypothetical protein
MTLDEFLQASPEEKANVDPKTREKLKKEFQESDPFKALPPFAQDAILAAFDSPQPNSAGGSSSSSTSPPPPPTPTPPDAAATASGGGSTPALPAGLSEATAAAENIAEGQMDIQDTALRATSPGYMRERDRQARNERYQSDVARLRELNQEQHARLEPYLKATGGLHRAPSDPTRRSATIAHSLDLMMGTPYSAGAPHGAPPTSSDSVGKTPGDPASPVDGSATAVPPASWGHQYAAAEGHSQRDPQTGTRVNMARRDLLQEIIAKRKGFEDVGAYKADLRMQQVESELARAYANRPSGFVEFGQATPSGGIVDSSGNDTNNNARGIVHNPDLVPKENVPPNMVGENNPKGSVSRAIVDRRGGVIGRANEYPEGTEFGPTEILKDADGNAIGIGNSVNGARIPDLGAPVDEKKSFPTKETHPEQGQGTPQPETPIYMINLDDDSLPNPPKSKPDPDPKPKPDRSRGGGAHRNRRR